MSEEGEKTCPLCAEEMDLTDQQLKPCKCGYQICVWCWNHIMEMAEKDETEGRCPACRFPYNKEKVVGLAKKCERLVAEMTMEKKMKTHKAKLISAEARKLLSSARVIQRNLVYVVGLPLTLADEEILQCKEYFGQYGKVLKVSISRTASGAIQNGANNSCSVYITYSKEEEAIRCIQYVHGFVLEGRPLKSCFGTTKYCHAWLRNVTCNNPACLYLHEVGSQDDSFTKDETLSAYTRILQITGATHIMQHRSGNKLPPPADDYDHSSSTSSGKPMSKSAITNTIASVKSSLPNGGSSHSLASQSSSPWGPPSLTIPNGNIKRMPETRSGSMTSIDVAATSQTQFQEDGKKGLTILNRSESEPIESVTNADSRTPSSNGTPTTGTPAMSNNSQLKFSLESKVKHESTENITKSVVNVTEGSLSEKKQHVSSSKGKVKDSSSSMLSSMVNGDIEDTSDRVRQQQNLEELPSEESLSSVATVRNNVELVDENCMSVEQDWPETVVNSEPSIEHDEFEEDLRHFENQRLKDPEVTRTNGFMSPSHIFHVPNHHRDQAEQLEAQVFDKRFKTSPFPLQSSTSATNLEILLNKQPIVLDQAAASSHSMHMQKTEVQFRDIDDCSLGSGAMGESNIISSILSMDFDSWDTSLKSSKNLSKLFSESDNDNDQVNLKLSSSLRGQNSSQSRFSFARNDDSRYEASHLRPSPSRNGQQPSSDHLSVHDFSRSRDMSLATNLGGFNNVPSNAYFHDSDIFSSGYPHLSSNKLSVSRAQTSAPPGFSAPSRSLQPPPPGFGAQERMEQPLDHHHMSGNHFLGVSSLLGNSYHQSPPKSNGSSVIDNEFMDPAIMAVVDERLPGGIRNGLSYHHHSQSNALKNEARLQLLMQRSAVPPLQNQGMVETSQMGNNGYFNLNDAYSRLMVSGEQNHISYPQQLNQLNHHQQQQHQQLQQPQQQQQQNRSNLMSKGLWDGWNEISSRNDRLGGVNKFFNGYENSNFRMGSENLYNGSYGNC
ncbi:uncharacterized protein LOC124936716 isoform X2 [Impatiens glandulifera]|uniref:uncharacterized protein LOC124936716 isoform X2 n=1 Tax=Impatiens glandulifera TaxID=253017 RepID=UPI001FB0C23D|nr:uncharacterized protein LOC124936716 isoform X2 [Impatiens glandulifera]